MTKQEEIEEILSTLCYKAKAKDIFKSPTGFGEEVKDAILELDKLGVVVKVGKNQVLPDRVYFSEKNKDKELELSGHTQMDILRAGYAKVESLI